MSPVRHAAGTVARATAAVATKPRLWSTAIRVSWRLVPDQWWKRAPFLPIPDPALLSFRSVTQYGDADATPSRDDIIAWLRWCKVEAQAGATR